MAFVLFILCRRDVEGGAEECLVPEMHHKLQDITLPLVSILSALGIVLRHIGSHPHARTISLEPGNKTITTAMTLSLGDSSPVPLTGGFQIASMHFSVYDMDQSSVYSLIEEYRTTSLHLAQRCTTATTTHLGD